MTDFEVKDAAMPLLFDPNQKKKKKKKKVVTEEEGVEEATAGVEEVSIGADGEGARKDGELDDAGAGTTADPGLGGLMDFGKKKKKKKPKVQFTGGEELEANSQGPKVDDQDESALPWAGTDRDYLYKEMLDRTLFLLHGKHAGVETKKTFRSRPPVVKKESNKKSLLVNFTDICKGYRRQPEHLRAYLCAELGSTGSLQSNGSLVMKGNFNEAGIESVLKRYIKEYVACGSCRSPDTVLIRDASSRLYFLQCESCGASRSVAGIKQGYVAQIGKRKH
uniref:Translation initiation factor IF2/IF5 domain-containing protein n=2 Tax=Rhodosorus marinus TaxID=101924 RepID=A0A7S3E8X0_9RHOD|mmetsp:Transcript_1533/g.5360  ORF Transcript_1533/g.5360 Transcript_1533/m.5360 type:complete len:278 (+) Transcript_1533:194-1027(+)|eukprot:CAMPEP_0113960528 /NCGR_PEP_ID=MMETSP0011_2-20120614/4762_1 /TAXON_ID=101924 /ORGANISM="Rhodosorus marinus" /LENGTH=277 /DNA_ID=CAMNT_0000971985 /DNA_START=119 /DNA_END=952 /DNA_ORIENTATION=+ /assembly_acc=CAM_ASM_000156